MVYYLDSECLLNNRVVGPRNTYMFLSEYILVKYLNENLITSDILPSSCLLLTGN